MCQSSKLHLDQNKNNFLLTVLVGNTDMKMSGKLEEFESGILCQEMIY